MKGRKKEKKCKNLESPEMPRTKSPESKNKKRGEKGTKKLYSQSQDAENSSPLNQQNSPEIPRVDLLLMRSTMGSPTDSTSCSPGMHSSAVLRKYRNSSSRRKSRLTQSTPCLTRSNSLITGSTKTGAHFANRLSFPGTVVLLGGPLLVAFRVGFPRILVPGLSGIVLSYLVAHERPVSVPQILKTS